VCAEVAPTSQEWRTGFDGLLSHIGLPHSAKRTERVPARTYLDRLRKGEGQRLIYGEHHREHQDGSEPEVQEDSPRKASWFLLLFAV
jgi:hypothetical protein